VVETLTAERKKDPKSPILEAGLVNRLGYLLLQSDTKAGVAVLRLNVDAHPASSNAWDSLGDAYLADGQKDKAREASEKALALVETDSAETPERRKLIRESAQGKLDQLKGTAAGAAGAETPQPPPTIASTVDRQISGIEKQVVEAAEAMPEDKFNFSPESLNIPGAEYKGVRTFALQVKHVAASNNILWSQLTGDTLPEDYKGGNGPAALTTKADILKFLKDSFALGHRAAASLTDQNMLRAPAAGKSSRLHLATFAVAHAFDHYGQMVEYLRMNGIVPPASRGKSD
jgi:tetratricopeptide (TPR) repeat protein